MHVESVEDDLLRTREAAAELGLTEGGFRSSVTASPLLRDARVMIDARTPAYPRWAIEEYKRSRQDPGTAKKRRDAKGRFKRSNGDGPTDEAQ